MKSRYFLYALTLGGMALMLAGCGSGVQTPGGTSVTETSARCVSCHDVGAHGGGKVTPGTGINVVTEWMRSPHKSNNGAGCIDCHEGGYGHTELSPSCSKCHTITGQTQNPIKNPDMDGKCAKCHDKVNPRQALGLNDGYKTNIAVPGMAAGTTTRFVHFSTGLRTSYVASSYRQNCRKCHNPHDTSLGREHRKQWAESGHGSTRGLARIGLDAKTRGSRIPLDQNFGNGNFCVRCHTSTGFINFVAGDQFTNANALPDIGPDGKPDPNGLRTSYPEYATSGTTIRGPGGVIVSYADKSREATNCDVCHVDSRGTDNSAYSGAVRGVALQSGVTIYYSYSSSGRGHSQSVTTVKYDTLGYSNLCLTCHSGRATGQTVKGLNTAYRSDALSNPLTLNFLNAPAAPSVHDFAGGAVLQGEKTAFLFYTSPLKYKTSPAHRSINTEGSGPCISCHMPRLAASQGGTLHSHLFRPVSWTNDDINDKITDIISYPTVCSSCHTETAAVFTAKMNDLREGFRMSLLILAALRPSSNNWTGKNTNGGLGAAGPTYGNLPVPVLGGLPAGAYTMGASFNYGFLFNEPSSYNHSPIMARQLIYDSIDWLKNGSAGFGSATSPATVYAAIKAVPLGTGLKWTKADPIQGAILGVIPNKDYNIFTTETDRDKALYYICKDYVIGSNLCNRW